MWIFGNFRDKENKCCSVFKCRVKVVTTRPSGMMGWDGSG
jgi:hypothetical protein